MGRPARCVISLSMPGQIANPCTGGRGYPVNPALIAFQLQVARLVQGTDSRVFKGAGLVGALMVLYLGVKVSPAIVFVLGTCIAMLLFSIYLATWVLRKDEGTTDMQEVGAIGRRSIF